MKKTIKLDDGEYTPVASRLKSFIAKFGKDHSIETSYEFTSTGIVFSARISADDKHSTGHSYCANLGAEKIFEKHETIAVGRALAFIGFGGDMSIASAEEMEELGDVVMDYTNEITKLKRTKSVNGLKKAWRGFTEMVRRDETVKETYKNLSEKYENTKS